MDLSASPDVKSKIRITIRTGSGAQNHGEYSCIIQDDASTSNMSNGEVSTSDIDRDCGEESTSLESSETSPSKNLRSTRRLSDLNKGEDTRSKRKKSRGGETMCPVCGITLRSGEVEHHLTHELDKLARLPNARPLSQRIAPSSSSSSSSSSNASAGATPAGSRSLDEPATSSSSSSSGGAVGSRPSSATTLSSRSSTSKPSDKGWETYQRIRANRRGRLRAKKRGGSGRSEEATCPVCNERVAASSQEELTAHVNQCLAAQTSGEDDEEEEVDVEGEGPFEEYEWCGQTRIRATSLLQAQGQLNVLGVRVRRSETDENEEVCVDEDDITDTFGPAQYSLQHLASVGESGASSQTSMEEDGGGGGGGGGSGGGSGGL